jgi:nicotinamide-nucleotide amidase
MMEAVLLAQGNELTTGATQDTNSCWLAARLWDLGIAVRRVVTVPDRLPDLIAVMQESAALAPLVIGTGGLGPTRDDLTREALAAAFSLPLEEDAVALAQVQARFAKFKRPMAPSNRRQAMVPRGGRILENRWGTAPGLTVEVDAAGRAAGGGRSVLYFMPGVPREMRPMFETWVAPDVVSRFTGERPTLHTVRVVGVGESELESQLAGLVVEGMEIGFRSIFPENHIKLLFRPGVPATARASAVSTVVDRVGWRAFGVDSGDLAAVVGERLVARGETVAVAESCTAGRLCAWLADTPGSSRYLMEGAVCYSNAAKSRTCGVAPGVIDTHGAVSEPVARQLAEGMRARAETPWGIGITGIAGPAGGSRSKPVGTVFISIAGPASTTCRRWQFHGDRDRVRTAAAAAGLSQLLQALGSD